MYRLLMAYFRLHSRLLPLEGETNIKGTAADCAAPDISSRRTWITFQRTYFQHIIQGNGSINYLISVGSDPFPKI